MEEKNIQKPLILEMDEAKQELIQWVNSTLQVRKLPFYIIDMMWSEIGAQIKEGAKNELDMARQQVQEQQVQEEQNNDEEVA